MITMGERIARFKCPKCHEYMFGEVTNTRPVDDGIIRRRKCENCGTSILTKEEFFKFAKKRTQK